MEYNYTRKTIGGCYCSSGQVDVAGKTLANVVEDALPGKEFTVRCAGTQATFDFSVALSGPDETTLTNTHTAWTPV